MKQRSHRPHPLEQHLAELRAENPTPYPDYTELHSVIEQRPDQLRIELPPEPFGPGIALLLLVFVVPWLVFEVGLAYLLTTLAPGERLNGALVLAATALMGIPLINLLCVPMFRREVLIFGREEWTVCVRILGWSHTRRFRLHDLTAVHLLPKDPEAHRSHELELVHAGGSIRWGRVIQSREAQLVADLIERWVPQTRATLR